MLDAIYNDLFRTMEEKEAMSSPSGVSTKSSQSVSPNLIAAYKKQYESSANRIKELFSKKE